MKPLSTSRITWLSLMACAAVWLVVSWPLPKFMTDGIPASSTNIEKYNSRYMVQGDHLQLHYFYWLFSDMVKGNTPWFHNLYEFNTGSDAERYHVGNYNIPFSLIYLGWDLVGSSAFAWNMLAFTTLWLTLLATWILLRRFVPEPIAGICALIAITLPYRYITLFGGSPMGHAMLWAPLVVLGLDMATRDLSYRGGLLAALVLLCAYYNDTRVFLFCVLTAPLWCFLGLLRREERSWTHPKYWSAVFLRLLPFGLVVVRQVVLGMRTKAGKFAETALAGGREVSEVAQFTPRPRGLFQWFTFGKDAHVFIGVVVPLICLTGLAWALALWVPTAARRRRTWKNDLALLLLIGLATAVVVLALGPNGPFDGFFYMQARRFLPAYDLMRMTAQIYCIMPTVLSLSLALALTRITGGMRSRRARLALIGLAGLLFLSEYALQIRTTVCRLPSEQAAYRAVAEDAAKRNKKARAMILPIWPGDTSWSAIYQHYATLYRIRMLNGYSPQVKTEYVDNIFGRLGRANIAVLPDENLDFLLDRDIDYIVLHEDAFPEKVSPFPVGFTIKRLLNHPRIEFLKRDGSIWSFRILRDPVGRPEIKPGWNLFFPTLHWELECGRSAGSEMVRNESASGGMFIELGAGDRTTPPPFKPWGAPEATLLVRVRGEGVLEAFDKQHAIRSRDWTWARFGIPNIGTSTLCEPVFTVSDGRLGLDVMLYFSGEWPEFVPGESILLPAALFFHAGYIDMETDAVVLRKDYEPDGAILYGPNLPLPAGRYRMEMRYTSAAPRDIELGQLRARIRGDRYAETSVVSGKSPAAVEFEYPVNLPFRGEFVFCRNADVSIQAVRILRTQ